VTRDGLIAAAIDVMDREGLDRLTMRRLAARAGCAPMSIYSYVRDRDDLIDGVLERLLAEVDFHVDKGDGWAVVLRRASTAYGEMVERHPDVFTLIANVKDDQPPMSEHIARGITALTSTGLSVDDAFLVFGIADAFATGFFVSRRVSRAPGSDDAAPGDAPEPVSRQVDPFTWRIRGLVGDDVWAEGIEVMIAGAQARLGLPPE
jgi:AcrR family transcriptional regulator